MSDFQSKLDASLADAATQLASREQGEKAAREQEHSRKQERQAKINQSIAIASQFKSNQLNPLMRAVAKSLLDQGYIVSSNEFNNDNGGSQIGGIGYELISSDRSKLTASILYDLDKVTIHLGSANKQFSQSEFSDGTALAWVEDELPNAVGKWVASGTLVKSPVVTYQGKVN